MSDLLRKLLYPLVLPCLVTAVWGYAWTRKYDDLMNAGGPVVTIPASGTPTVTTGCAPVFELVFIGGDGSDEPFKSLATTGEE